MAARYLLELWSATKLVRTELLGCMPEMMDITPVPAHAYKLYEIAGEQRHLIGYRSYDDAMSVVQHFRRSL